MLLSYKCPMNALGDRKMPKKKDRNERRKRKFEENERQTYEIENENEDDIESDENVENPALESLAAIIWEENDKRTLMNDGPGKKKKYKKSSYFSDEEELE